MAASFIQYYLDLGYHRNIVGASSVSHGYAGLCNAFKFCAHLVDYGLRVRTHVQVSSIQLRYLR